MGVLTPSAALLALVAAFGSDGGVLAAPQAGIDGTRRPFVIGGVTVAPGQRVDLELPVAAGALDPATRVPVTVFHGAHAGPVLAITMGVHGYEFPSILAGQRLLERIQPTSLRGTVVLVRVAHVEAFEQRVPYVNPFDRKNLNRVFPGRPDGTQSERIAWALTTDVIRRSDLHIEVHSGDGAEWLEPFVGVYGGRLAEAQFAASLAIGLAFGLDNVVLYSMDTQDQVDRGRSLNRQAVADGKPTILVEVGENGRRDDAFVDTIVRGVESVLASLRMTGGTPLPAAADLRWFAGTTGADATATGILTPVATRGRDVAAGELLGTIRDYAGRLLQEVRAPVAGYALYGLAGPPVKAGESVVAIAIPARQPSIPR